ncbi:TonB-dependent receptor plug domain-containing protein [Desulfonema magnum]|uniref:TonB-dependent receptor domain-containing protein n=1 Tax=Desulfonema magnum TaxID=45655 RepID=A0A975GQ88_9BACT|nr:TonB-dependent receptor [Desulfonema magnum]QTA89624.1 TonB-dependent receptor domain-containing protein [Desulfonema magnum]
MKTLVTVLIVIAFVIVNINPVFSQGHLIVQQEDDKLSEFEEAEAELDEELKWVRAEAETVVVGVSKYEQRLMDVPATVSVLDMSDISAQTKTNIPELLRTVPGVTVYRNHGDSPWYRVSMRGLNDNFFSAATLITIDGTPFFQPHGGGVDLSWLPMANIERAEVIKGTFSTLYGANAFGGVINIVTKKGKQKNESGQGSNTNMAIQVSACENIDESSDKSIAVTGMTSHSGQTGAVSYHLSAEMLSDEGYRQNWQVTPIFLGPQSRTGLFSDELDQERAQFSWHMDMPAGLSFSGFYTRDKKDILGMNDDLDDRILHTVLSLASSPTERYDYLLRLYHNRFEEVQDATETFRFPGDTTSQPFFYDLLSFTTGGEFQNRFRYSDALKLVFGADFRADTSELQVSYRSGEEVRSFGYPRKHIQDYGAYFQAEYVWQNKFSVIPGIRYDYDSESGCFVSGKLAALYHIHNDHSLYGVAGRGFRSPNFNERFVKVFGKSGSDDLKPEKTWQFELGSKNRFFQDRIHWDICAFYTFTKDYIDTNLEKVYTNTQGLTIWGAETDWSWKMSSTVRTFATFSVIIGKDEETDKDIARVPSHQWTTGLSYDDQQRWAANLTVRGVSHNILGDPAKNYIRAESYQVADISLSRRVAVGESLFTVTLFADNLFDEQYVEAWPGAVSTEGGHSKGLNAGLRMFVTF